ncbi:SigE family RNA polymerase sigma factor [Aquihabitans daechungensis]|uniref:SigE family RNA polymerase sigma factor n=1 Tax=Aquihabitans daechungensis TaxID=1052257 RepID=UPI003BA1CAED
MSRGARSGPPGDLAAFYAEQFDRVRGSLVLFTGSREAGEELAQEAFVRACQHWEKVRVMDAPGAWVQRVGINLAISRGRRLQSERRPHRRLRDDQAAAPSDPGDGGELRRALLALDPDERAVVVLRFYGDLSVAQVADVLDIPEGTVKTRTRTGLAALRESGVPEAVALVDEPVEEQSR